MRPRHADASIRARRRLGWASGLFALAAAGLLFIAPGRAQTAPAALLPPAAEAAVGSIAASDLEAHVRYLSGREMEGRGAGQPGSHAAVEYVADALDRLAMRPADGSSYLQGFDLHTVGIGGTNSLELVDESGGDPLRYVVGDEFHPHPSSATASVAGELVFAGYGITARDLRYDDYAGLEVSDRIVIVLDQQPQQLGDAARAGGRSRSPHAAVSRKAATAAERGAIGLIVVPASADRADEPPRGAARVWNRGGSARHSRFVRASEIAVEALPIALVSTALGERLLQTPGGRPTGIAGFQETIDRAIRERSEGELVGAPASFAVPGRHVALDISIERRIVQAHNVLGLLEGHDPTLRDDLVVVGAHLDHEGVDEDKGIYPGADDNASGVASALEVAEALRLAAAGGERTRRSVLFAFWNAEEKGLLGSRHYLQQPVPPGARIVAKLNLDMIGRSEDVPDRSDPRLSTFRRTTAADNASVLHVIGTTYSPDLGRALRLANAAVGLTLRTEYDSHASNLLRRSDHWPFLEGGIPALFITTGLHPDYHTPDDTADRIEYQKLERITQLVYRGVWQLATQDRRPGYIQR